MNYDMQLVMELLQIQLTELSVELLMRPWEIILLNVMEDAMESGVRVFLIGTATILFGMVEVLYMME